MEAALVEAVDMLPRSLEYILPGARTAVVSKADVWCSSFPKKALEREI